MFYDFSSADPDCGQCPQAMSFPTQDALLAQDSVLSTSPTTFALRTFSYDMSNSETFLTLLIDKNHLKQYVQFQFS